MNTPDYRGSLKEAYLQQSMQEKHEIIREEEKIDSSTGKVII